MSTGQTFAESKIEEALVALTREAWRAKCEADKIQMGMDALEFRGADADTRKISALSKEDETRLDHISKDIEIALEKEVAKHRKAIKTFDRKRRALDRFFKNKGEPEVISPFILSLEVERAKRLGWLMNKPF